MANGSTATARRGAELAADFPISFPHDETVDQDEEFCEVVIDGETRRIRFHDYDKIYSVPGLYEQLFYKELKCQSPERVREALEAGLLETDLDADDLRVLDIGAGNGMVGEQLRDMGADYLFGVDIIEEALEALDRDRPDLYDDYAVADLTDIQPDLDARLEEADINCLTTVAALGFGDIPPEAFAGAYNYVADGGVVAMSIKSEFIEAGDGSGFSRLIKSAIDKGALEVVEQRRYRHRYSGAGEPLHYDALIAEKRGDLPTSF